MVPSLSLLFWLEDIGEVRSWSDWMQGNKERRYCCKTIAVSSASSASWEELKRTYGALHGLPLAERQVR